MELLVRESAQLAECEAVIERGLQTFVEVGNALLTIRDNRLYRAEWGTFEDYCRERWGFTRMSASQLISAVEVAKNIDVNPGLQIGEKHLRPLTCLPAEVQTMVWEQAVASAPNGKVTASHVQKVVNRYTRRARG